MLTDFPGLTSEQIQSITGVDDATMRRWRRSDGGGMSRSHRALLALYDAGYVLPSTWRKLARFEGEYLAIEQAEWWTLGEFRERFWLNQMLADQVGTLRRRVEHLSQPVAADPPGAPLVAVEPVRRAPDAPDMYARRFRR